MGSTINHLQYCNGHAISELADKLDMLDPALQPGQLDRKVEFGLPDLESWTFKIHTQTMNCADICSVCMEASMYAI